MNKLTCIFDELDPPFTGNEEEGQLFHYRGRHFILYFMSEPLISPVSKDFFYSVVCPNFRCGTEVKFFTNGQKICDGCGKTIALYNRAILVEEATRIEQGVRA